MERGELGGWAEMGFVQSCREPSIAGGLDFHLQGWESDSGVGGEGEAVSSWCWGRNQSQKEVAHGEGMCCPGAWPSEGGGGHAEIKKLVKKPGRQWLLAPSGRVPKLAAGAVSGREGPRLE